MEWISFQSSHSFSPPELTESDDNLTKEFITTQLRVSDSGGLKASATAGQKSRNSDYGQHRNGKRPRKLLFSFKWTNLKLREVR